MNKEDSLYIKKKFGAKILSILKRLAGGSSTDTLLVVRCIHESDWQVNKTSQEVIQALDDGRAVLYFVKESDGWHTASIISTYGATVELLYCSFYEANDNSAICERINHVDNHITRQ